MTRNVGSSGIDASDAPARTAALGSLPLALPVPARLVNSLRSSGAR